MQELERRELLGGVKQRKEPAELASEHLSQIHRLPCQRFLPCGCFFRRRSITDGQA